MTEALQRLLGEWDNVLLAHADRTRMFDDETRRRLAARPGPTRPKGTCTTGFARCSDAAPSSGSTCSPPLSSRPSDMEPLRPAGESADAQLNLQQVGTAGAEERW